jgi:DNA-binding transcriptional ArsR family regulator
MGGINVTIMPNNLIKVLEALANPYRLRIIALLKENRIYVSQLARELLISRPLLYMHLKKLEDVGLVTSKLELSEGGRAVKYYEGVPFSIVLNQDNIAEAIKDTSNKKEKN